ncbi:helix-turn-helix transcriptional regulator [Secundilactobacillus odoratitofui]|nr:YafY family protein [Secundilactobacillus odoratitofui]
MRLSRLLNMVMWLLREERVSAKEMATEFEVTTRTIYRDVDALNMAGIPIYATRGRNGGIGILPNYKVDKKLLTEADIGNLLVALGGVQSLIDTPAIRETVQKMRAMYQPEDHGNLYIQHADWTGSEELKQLAVQFNLAIEKHQLVQFSYSDREGNVTMRQLEPYRLTYKSERWYIQGYSLERQAFRTFRLSRIRTIEFLPVTFQPREIPIGQFDNIGYELPKFVPVTILADNIVRDVIVERFSSRVISDESKTHFRAHLQLPQTDSGYRFILSLGVHVKICDAPQFVTGLRIYLGRVLGQYPTTDPQFKLFNPFD